MVKNALPALMLALVVSLTFFGCKKANDRTFDENNPEGFFPLEKGRYVVYDVDSTIWDDFTCDTVMKKMQMRYTIADSFRDDQNRKSYRIEIYQRPGVDTPWSAHSVVYVTTTPNSLEWVQNNLRFIKLVFPVEEGETWKGNAYISPNDQDYQYFNDWTYRYTSYKHNYDNERLIFENTVTVNQVDEALNLNDSLAYGYRTFGKEVYAYDVGMIYREMERWTYDPSVKCRKGFKVEMRAVDHN